MARVNEKLDSEAAPWWEGRPGTRDQLILHYMPFAEKLATMGAKRNPHITYEECLSCACLRLIEAVEKYDPSSAATFTTFAQSRIQWSAHDAAREHDWMPHSVRIAAKASGNRNVPAMLAFDEAFDSMELQADESVSAHWKEVAQFVEFPVHRRMVLDSIEVGLREAAKRTGCSLRQLSKVIGWAMERAQKRYVGGDGNRPASH